MTEPRVQVDLSDLFKEDIEYLRREYGLDDVAVTDNGYYGFRFDAYAVSVYKAEFKKESRVVFDVRLVACLPRIRKDATGTIYVFNGDRLEFYGSLAEVVQYLRDNTSRFSNVRCDNVYRVRRYSESLLGDVLAVFPVTDGHIIIAGVDGGQFVDAYQLIRRQDPAAAAAGLAELAQKILKWYGVNADRALFNVAMYVPAVLSHVALKDSAVRHVVYNKGEGGEGKSLLFNLLTRMYCDSSECVIRHMLKLDGTVNTEAQYRNLLAHSELPLLLDEQTLTRLARNAPILLSATTGIISGVHAARYGSGFGAIFRVRRVLFIATNVELSRLVRKIESEASLYAYLRRIVNVEWEPVRLSPTAAREIASYTPPAAADLAATIWSKYQNELRAASDLIDLARRFWLAVAREYGADVTPYLSALEAVPAAARESASVSEAEAIWRKIREEVDPRGELSDIAVFAKLLQRADLVAYVSNCDTLERFFMYKINLEEIGRQLAGDQQERGHALLELHMALGLGKVMTRDSEELARTFAQLIAECRYPVLKANTPIIGRPRELLGEPKARGVFGYYYRVIDKLYKSIVATQVEEVEYTDVKRYDDSPSSPPSPSNFSISKNTDNAEEVYTSRREEYISEKQKLEGEEGERVNQKDAVQMSSGNSTNTYTEEESKDLASQSGDGDLEKWLEALGAPKSLIETVRRARQ